MRKLKEKRKGKSTSLVREEIQEITSSFVSIVRTEEGLKEGKKD